MNIGENIDCCGCSACYCICPFSAIKMSFDGTGSYHASINEKLCRNCGLCTQVCPVIHTEEPQLSARYVYVGVSKDINILQNSSSGGIAYALSKKAIETGCAVCGCVYDNQQEAAVHKVVEQAEQLKNLQGSKYLQSANAEAFKKIVENGSGLVIGTPCQIAGLDAVLKRLKLRDNYILVDIFCHGVPNQFLWVRHLEDLKKKAKIKDFDGASFRDRKHYILHIGVYNASYNQDAFYTFFLRGRLKMHRCYDCHLRRTSAADIRLGDCMAEKYSRLSFSPSCVIANTDAGRAFLDACKPEVNLYPESFSVVDLIQEKENMSVPVSYEKDVEQLKSGKCPESLIKGTMLISRVKGRIKHLLKSPHTIEDYNLEKYI